MYSKNYSCIINITQVSPSFASGWKSAEALLMVLESTTGCVNVEVMLWGNWKGDAVEILIERYIVEGRSEKTWFALIILETSLSDALSVHSMLPMFILYQLHRILVYCKLTIGLFINAVLAQQWQLAEHIVLCMFVCVGTCMHILMSTGHNLHISKDLHCICCISHAERQCTWVHVSIIISDFVEKLLWNVFPVKSLMNFLFP